MNKDLNKHLDQISKLIAGLKGSDADLEKLIELDRSLDLLSHKIKTARLDGFTNETEILGQGIRQDAVLYFDSDFRVVRFVGSLENIFGSYKKKLMPGISDFLAPADFVLLKEKTEVLLKTNEPQAFDANIISKNGILLPVNILLEKISFGNNENVIAAGLVFHRQSPSDLNDYQEILIENLPGMDVFLFDTQFRHVLAVGREKKKLKLTNADFTGKTLFEVYDEKTQKRLFPFYRNALDGKVSEGEVRIKDYVYFISATPVFGIDKQVVGGALISQDVTKEKEIERKLIKAKREAENADKTKSLFLANMSHEIRTPLNAIIGFTGMLGKTELTPRQKKFSQLINQSSEHLLSVVNEILFLFKLGMGKVYIEQVPFNVRELVQNVHESLLLRANEKKLDFRYKVQSGVNEIVIGDPFRIKQILMNLAGNAIKFTDNGSVSIFVSREKQTRKNTFLRFEVEDTGTGISKDDLNIIFDEFAQSGQGNERNRKGTGLGLTIVRKLVELLNGRLHVESELNKGSKFTVVIPFELPGTKKTATREKEYEIEKNLLEGKKVLYADDDENNVLLGESILADWKTEYEIARDGNEALRLLKDNKFDIVLLDIHMPGLSGVDVVKKVRNEKGNLNRETKILAVTANIMESDIKKYLKSGFDDYILKPFREEKLYNKICSMLDLEQPVTQISAKPVSNERHVVSGSGFNTSLLLKTAQNDFEFFNQMIDTFVENASGTVENLRRYLKDENWEGIGKVAHKAIPSFRYFGLTHLVNNLMKLEDYALREKNYRKVGPLAGKTLEMVEEVIPVAQNAKIPGTDR